MNHFRYFSQSAAPKPTIYIDPCATSEPCMPLSSSVYPVVQLASSSYHLFFFIFIHYDPQQQWLVWRTNEENSTESEAEAKANWKLLGFYSCLLVKRYACGHKLHAIHGRRESVVCTYPRTHWRRRIDEFQELGSINRSIIDNEWHAAQPQKNFICLILFFFVLRAYLIRFTFFDRIVHCRLHFVFVGVVIVVVIINEVAVVVAFHAFFMVLLLFSFYVLCIFPKTKKQQQQLEIKKENTNNNSQQHRAQCVP